MTPESKVKARVKKVLKEISAFYSMTVTGGFGNSGDCDFYVCHRGRFYGIECKANGNKPTALQLKRHEDIRRAGGIVLVIDETNIETLRKELSDEQED